MTRPRAMHIVRRLAATALAALLPDAAAVTLNPDGLGQALVYPYYTVRAAGGNAFNTYLSVTNHAADAKALRVRLREGRNSREVLAFNLYLGPFDSWAAAIIPGQSGASLVTTDLSCTDPAFPLSNGVAIAELSTASFTDANGDGAGVGQERVREGFVEILEMATLTGDSAAAVTPSPAGMPPDCAALHAGGPQVASPGGKLSGALTLINVASGLDFTVAADALADLSTQPFFRPAADPYPDFAAVEIKPVSVVGSGRTIYRSTWSRGVDAVSAVLMRSRWGGEFVLDAATASLTDMVVTMPTRHHYVTATAASAPFSRRAEWNPACGGGADLGEQLTAHYADRDARTGTVNDTFCDFTTCPPRTRANSVCASAAVGSVLNGREHTHPPGLALARSNVLGSETLGLLGGYLVVAPTFDNGWIEPRASEPSPAHLTSLPTSQRLDTVTGAVALGPHSYAGLPVTGFTVRIFSNGTLACGEGACQGNYGGAFPLRYRRAITP